LYLAYNAPHWNLQAKTADIERYKGVYDIGWDQIREQRLARQKQLGVISPACVLSLRNEEVPAWATLKQAQKTEYAEAMAIYAGAITAMDRGVGQVLATLDKTKLRDNTLVIFLSDNGACAEGATGVKRKPNSPHESARIGPGWANVGNTPFRYWKNTTWEGGSATELILNWPAGLAAAQRGAITHQVGHLIDLMPTCVELAGANYPATFKGNQIAPMEGRSLVPTLSGQLLGPRELFW
jgi:arylsulfatase A-like enzyme